MLLYYCRGLYFYFWHFVITKRYTSGGVHDYLELIEQHGESAADIIMPKVKSALEMLKSTCKLCEKVEYEKELENFRYEIWLST